MKEEIEQYKNMKKKQKEVKIMTAELNLDPIEAFKQGYAKGWKEGRQDMVEVIKKEMFPPRRPNYIGRKYDLRTRRN